MKNMGILIDGVFGDFVNKVGPLVGRVVNKRNVISMLPHKSLKPYTQAQINQQLKFALIVWFFNGIKDLIDIGFGKSHLNSLNAAVKYNFKNVIEGDSPNFSINYAKIVYSKGKLAGPNTAICNRLYDNQVVFSWQPDRENELTKHNDRACFLVYDPVKKSAVTAITTVKRADLSYSFWLPTRFRKTELHCYMSFFSANRREVSNSIYLGILKF